MECVGCGKVRHEFECTSCLHDRVSKEHLEQVNLQTTCKALKAQLSQLVEQQGDFERISAANQVRLAQRKLECKRELIELKKAEIARKQLHFEHQKQLINSRAHAIGNAHLVLERQKLSETPLPAVSLLHVTETSQQQELQLLRRELVSNVLRIFPIRPSVEIDACTVLEYDVPNSGDMSELSDNQVAHLMGTFVRVLDLLSSYLGLPLRHTMIFSVSTSRIIGPEEKQYRLYKADVPQTEFREACALLNDNAVYLLVQATRCEVQPRHRLSTAACLVDIFRSKNIGSDVWSRRPKRLHGTGDDEKWELIEKE